MNNPPTPVIFIGGVHGVGKTTFSKSLSDTLKIPSFTAGDLIRAHRARPVTEDKRVGDISGNQDALVEAIRLLGISTPILLDGHYCLLDANAAVSEVPIRTFQQLTLCVSLVIRDDPALIRERLQQRDSKDYDLDLIAAFQDAEIAWSQKVAAILKIPIALFDCSESDHAASWVADNLPLEDRG